MKEYTSLPPTFSNISSINGGGNGSWTQALFKFSRSTHIQIPPIFLSWTTIGLIYSDSSTSSMIHVEIILSNSCQTFSSYFGFILYGLFLVVFASGFFYILISPRYHVIPFIYKKVIMKMS